ncbi:MAG: phosphoglycolate phosphatase [Burkholderiaceae bacterium]
MENIKAVFIDLDGTLLDTIADLAAAANRVRADFDLAALPREQLEGFVGKGADVLVHRSMTGSLDGQLDTERFHAARASFDKHYTRENGRSAKPYPGVLAGLEKMKAAGLSLACLTNKPQSFTDPLLDAQGLAEFFALTLGGDALPRKKPDPLPLTHAAVHFGLAPAQCVMVGDSVNDAQAARAAGMPVLLVPYGYNEGRDVATIDSDGIVGSLDKAADLIIRS